MPLSRSKIHISLLIIIVLIASCKTINKTVTGVYIYYDWPCRYQTKLELWSDSTYLYKKTNWEFDVYSNGKYSVHRNRIILKDDHHINTEYGPLKVAEMHDTSLKAGVYIFEAREWHNIFIVHPNLLVNGDTIKMPNTGLTYYKGKPVTIRAMYSDYMSEEYHVIDTSANRFIISMSTPWNIEYYTDLNAKVLKARRNGIKFDKVYLQKTKFDADQDIK